MAYLSDAVIDALRVSRPLGIFLHVATDPALRVWMGVTDFEIGIDSVDPSGAVYRGAGRLIEVPQLDLLINGQGDQIAFGLSGVDADFIARLSTEAPEVRGAKVYVGIAPLDDRWQPMTPIIRIWRGVADRWVPNCKPPSDPTKSHVYSIALHVAVGDTSRAQRKAASFTSAWQQERSPGDRFFERVVRYVRQLMVPWPKF